MKTIHKQILELKASQPFFAHVFAKPLCVQRQANRFCIWYETPNVIDANDFEVSRIHIIGTGQLIPEGNLEYINTVQDGTFVWHFYLERAN